MCLGIPIVALVNNTLLFGYLLQKQLFIEFGNCIFISIAFTCLYWFTFRYIYFYYIKQYPLEIDNRTRRMNTLTMMLAIFVLFQFLIEKSIRYLWDPIMQDMQPNFILKILTSFIFSFLVIALYEIVFLSYQVSISIKEKEELKREKLSSELSGLKEQLNPHFLFNSLNTLSALISTEPLRAESFVSKLARVYRYILDKGSEDIVSLHQELNYLQAYIHLLKERFGESLIVNLNVDEMISMNKKIIPLSLQICFENCVKHNIVTYEKPLTVEICFSGQYIFVINNLQPLQLNEPASGVGIKNIKKRYAYFTNLPVVVDSNEKTFSIGLPLL